MAWFTVKNDFIEFKIFVKPNAKRTAVIEINDTQGMIIALHASPHEGEANQELIKHLAKLLRTPKSTVVIHRGEHSRHKVIRIPCNSTTKDFFER
ncbi:MAG: DUF167 domain-containing protein [Gammaproteobacteria bacterium]|nr:DUF167 domain-containing protein [Gammaproteobacteria bacterium]